MAKIRSWMELMPYEKLTTKLSKFMYSPSLPCSCWAAIVLSHTLVPDFPLVFLVWNYAADVWLLLNTSLRWSLYCWCDHSKGILFLAPLFVVISVCWFWVYLLFHCPSHPLSYSGQSFICQWLLIVSALFQLFDPFCAMDELGLSMRFWYKWPRTSWAHLRYF